MSHDQQNQLPQHYQSFQSDYPSVAKALEELGSAVRKAGPLDTKTAHLIQLAAAAANRSEGSVCSHARRALEAGASAEEIRHTLILLTSTIGFPASAAALNWVNDLFNKQP